MASFVHNVKAWKSFLQCLADKAVCQGSVLGPGVGVGRGHPFVICIGIHHNGSCYWRCDIYVFSVDSIAINNTASSTE
jgi:hypothetical protein